ncbi:MAG: hypothetical protein R6U86_06475, partial [Bacteroidales bacterium]
LFERYLGKLQTKKSASQQLLFPENIHLIDSDADLLAELIPQLEALGFRISPLKKGTFVIQAVPSEMIEKDPLQEVIEGILEHYMKNKVELKDDIKTNLARSISKKMALKHGSPLSEEEMNALTEDLFACQMPYQSPAGKPTVRLLDMDELSGKFK